jgi:hypothetical protein
MWNEKPILTRMHYAPGKQIDEKFYSMEQHGILAKRRARFVSGQCVRPLKKDAEQHPLLHS